MGLKAGQTQHAGLAFREVEGTGQRWEKGVERTGRNQERNGQHLHQGRSSRDEKDKDNIESARKEGLSLAD